MDNFKGDLNWVHKWEGHLGKPYWPKGQSGITLDPGVDLGYIDLDLFRASYHNILNQAQMDDLLKYAGKKGDEAGQALREAFDQRTPMTTIRISRDQADALFGVVAGPYWRRVCQRFAGLDSEGTPGVVQTVFLSLAYNRGPNNRDLEQLREPLDQADWKTIGQRVAGMQQDHKLEGIRRRRREEGQLILAQFPG